MTSSLSISANPRMPAPTNEPARDFVPGSAESLSVSAAIAGLRSARRELPLSLIHISEPTRPY